MSAPFRLQCDSCKDKEGPFVVMIDPLRPGAIFLCPNCVVAKQGKDARG